ncbi:hypothetical protein ACSS6W_002189 [Trichoderma asperelloides]
MYHYHMDVVYGGAQPSSSSAANIRVSQFPGPQPRTHAPAAEQHKAEEGT